MAEFCIHEKHGGICEKTDTYCNLGACPYEDLKEYDPVRYGKWGNYEPYSDGYRCSCCKLVNRGCTRYCPNCGAKMDLE